MAGVFVRVCASPCTTSHLLKFCVSVATALLVEATQSHSPPYSSFAEAGNSLKLILHLDMRPTRALV